jgi:hypothetical protein
MYETNNIIEILSKYDSLVINKYVFIINYDVVYTYNLCFICDDTIYIKT